MTQNGETRLIQTRVGSGAVAAANVAFSVLFFPSAISNASLPAHTEVPGSATFHHFYAILSLSTPCLMAASAITIIGGLICSYRKLPAFVKALRAAQVQQRAIFWLLTLRVISLTGLSSAVVNESGNATFLLLTAILLIVPGSIAAAGAFYIGKLLRQLAQQL